MNPHRCWSQHASQAYQTGMLARHRCWSRHVREHVPMHAPRHHAILVGVSRSTDPCTEHVCRRVPRQCKVDLVMAYILSLSQYSRPWSSKIDFSCGMPRLFLRNRFLQGLQLFQRYTVYLVWTMLYRLTSASQNRLQAKITNQLVNL